MKVRRTSRTARVRTVIMGAAGRDFHNFNTVYRSDPNTEVIAFTATQIPGIAGRRYPASLAGRHYPRGIPIFDESRLDDLLRRRRVQRVVFAYSDVSFDTVMHAASRVLAAGADFVLLGPERTMLKAAAPVIAVTAVRTGCGKSQVARHVSGLLKARGLKTAVIRHPMPYGNLARQAVQRFATRADLDHARCTIEEREEYEPHLAVGNIVFAGIDYGRIAAMAASESDVILWDGGNNDFPFLAPDLHIVLADALRPGHESRYHPGEAVLRMADIVVVAKTNAAAAADILAVEQAARDANPRARVVRGASVVSLERAAELRGQRVLVVEDGPTITHGGMATGAGFAAARAAGAAEIIDPRPFAQGPLRQAFETYPHIGPVLPAMGYDEAQVAALAATITAAKPDLVVVATPMDLGALAHLPAGRVVRARYEYADADPLTLADAMAPFLRRLKRRTC